ncbi:DEAD/DEAH box helicase [Brumimicrobium glaciale]|uniref:DEAD/DEAH box helicase n=1 Tax=Brumimicrobium glaciale TaxID=200475 RepID=A0A4Q4KMT2_9FLAO|nr:DEAD/DEAH box helicase [Brumimicrobium glaciale]RYM34665.1 DEAD/DEAH box helicase [Brumimicrobium glaciale]
MANIIKSQQDILDKLNINGLNPMQQDAKEVIEKTENTIVLSPTGTGKTLAFLLPLFRMLDPKIEGLQALIVVPSRELAIQIEQVFRHMGTGFKLNAVYGGRSKSKDRTELKHTPSVLIGTPGRILDHFTDERMDTDTIKYLVLDEFDKILEIGFEEELTQIISFLPNLKKRILTSATSNIKIPTFVKMSEASTLNYLKDRPNNNLEIKVVETYAAQKLETLVKLLKHVGNQNGIVFCNFKATIDEVSEYLETFKISHSCFSGGMEQIDRERSLIKFRNGSTQVLVATDLAARGLDIPELSYIIHYELPHANEEFTHRNGRTARVTEKGTAYIIKDRTKNLPDFIRNTSALDQLKTAGITTSFFTTLFISGGRKDKISKGDIAGVFMKKGGLTKDELGMIELKQDCAFVAVPLKKADELVDKLNNTYFKKKKVRIYGI